MRDLAAIQSPCYDTPGAHIIWAPGPAIESQDLELSVSFELLFLKGITCT